MGIDAFESIVEWLRTSYEVVTLGELVTRAGSDKSLEGLAALTFDDAYRGVFDHALPVLSRAGVPCTVFVVTDFAETPAFTWWDALAARGLLTEGRRERALWAHRGLAQDVLSEGDAAETETDLPEVFLPATWDRLHSAVGDGVTVGSHTARHVNLAALTSSEAEEELSRSHRSIEERVGRPPESVSYPYGLWTPGVPEVAARVGYAVGVTLVDRPTRRGDNPLGVPRINVPARISLEALECWAAGLRFRRPA